MEPKNTNRTPFIVTIILAVAGLFSFSFSLDIPIHKLLQRAIVPSPSPIPTSTKTPIPFPTPTPIPTSTPIPTNTPIPTSTPVWYLWSQTATEIPFRELFRYAESHIGEKVYFRAKVFHVLESEGDFILQANVTHIQGRLWKDQIYLKYDNAPIRILEDDIIHLVATMDGIITYTSVSGNQVTVPSLTVLKLLIEQ